MTKKWYIVELKSDGSKNVLFWYYDMMKADKYAKQKRKIYPQSKFIITSKNPNKAVD